MVKLAICDDETTAIETAKRIVYATSQKLKKQVEVDTYKDGNEILNRILKKKDSLDILLLDIDMPKISGLKTAEKLRESGDETLIMFVTAHDEYVFTAYKYQPYRYIRKSFMTKELSMALSDAFRVIAARADREITVKTEDDESRRIMLSKIIYYEVYERKIAIYLNDGAEIITERKTIKEMQELVPDKRFILLHRNCVVNADYVKKFGDCSVVLDDEQKLIVSRLRMKDVKLQLLEYWGDTM
jgi:DNA-binding LytR/AlgR family response regulator